MMGHKGSGLVITGRRKGMGRHEFGSGRQRGSSQAGEEEGEMARFSGSARRDVA